MTQQGLTLIQPSTAPMVANGTNSSGGFNTADIELIRATVAKGATNEEFKLLMRLAEKYGLDPFAKQIWCVKYGTSAASIFTSRDGFLSIAHRSGKFDGMEAKAIYSNDGKLMAASCTVWHKGMTHPFVVEVDFAEYNTGQNQWKTRPVTMLKKVAESQCLRRAFNISGLYEPSEFPENETGTYLEPIKLPTPRTPIVTPLDFQFQLDRLLMEYQAAQNLDELKSIFSRATKLLGGAGFETNLRAIHNEAKARIENAVIETVTPDDDGDTDEF